MLENVWSQSWCLYEKYNFLYPKFSISPSKCSRAQVKPYIGLIYIYKCNLFIPLMSMKCVGKQFCLRGSFSQPIVCAYNRQIIETLCDIFEKWFDLFCFPKKKLHLFSLFQTYQTCIQSAHLQQFFFMIMYSNIYQSIKEFINIAKVWMINLRNCE